MPYTNANISMILSTIYVQNLWKEAMQNLDK